MRKAWTDTTLDEVAIVVNGSTPSTKESEYWGGDIPWITTTELTACDGGYISSSIRKITSAAIQTGGARLVRSGATLLGTTATIGTAALTLVDTSFNQQISGLLPKSEKVLDKFIFLWARGNRLQLDDLAAGTSFKRISTVNLRNLSFVLPPLAEQKRIVDVVSSVDSYIDALQQQADTALTARNAVLHELLSNAGDDWTETSLEALISLRTGKLDVNAGVEDGEFPFFTCSRNTYKIDIAAYSGKSVIVAGNGDLNVKYYEGEFNAYQRTYILQVIDESVLNPIFLFHFMDEYVETLRSDTQGSTIQYLKKAQFADAPISLPPLAEQKRIVEIVSSMDDVIQSTEQALADAKNLRSGLLSDLLSGEHEIPASYDSLLGAA